MNVFYKESIDNLAVFPIVYANVRRLTLRLPLDNYFWAFIPTLDHLIALEIIEMREKSQLESQMKVLLNRASRLKYLSFDATSLLKLVQSNIAHLSLSQIHLKHYRTRINRYMNAEQCLILANSFIGRECEVLTIRIDDRNIILDLVDKMCNLRALHCECQNDFWMTKASLSPDDELVKWLRSSLPENYSISQHRSRLLQLWINRCADEKLFFALLQAILFPDLKITLYMHLFMLSRLSNFMSYSTFKLVTSFSLKITHCDKYNALFKSKNTET
ncbi:unnamed protein product [Rotaria socialis]|uniref:Uncharacterized protein n=1 Tax=Rotaria socialis TaxID=392032 RepID=A0A820P3Q3_9BILA|nr:unnamed protein product [Rotaria socialis]CAF4398404.1 unnamed protein product [Rotaria socialis]